MSSQDATQAESGRVEKKAGLGGGEGRGRGRGWRGEERMQKLGQEEARLVVEGEKINQVKHRSVSQSVRSLNQTMSDSQWQSRPG